MRSIIFIIIFLLSFNIFTFSDQDFEREFLTKIVYLEWRVFGKIMTEDYGKKLEILEMHTWKKIKPYKSRFVRVKELLDFYFSDHSHIKYISARLRKRDKLKIKVLSSVHSSLDSPGEINIEVSEDYYFENTLVFPKGCKGVLEITHTSSRKALFRNGKIKGRIKYIKTWYNYPVYFDEEYKIKNKVTINPLMGGLGYIVAGFKGVIAGLTIPKSENVFLKKEEEFYIKAEKDVILWGISFK